MKSLGEIEPIQLEYVFQVRIDFAERVSFETPTGRRAYVPAISGVVEGPRLRGRVVPHSGADFAANGRLNAHYMLQASDGAMIYIHNTGYLYPADGKPLDRSDPYGGMKYLATELCEFSFVSVPANAGATIVERSGARMRNVASIAALNQTDVGKAGQQPIEDWRARGGAHLTALVREEEHERIRRIYGF